uniref:Chalcone-flavonone isomerase family protein n=1 Tax=Goniophlebium niponicum TaxID=126675 RepID=A0A4Y6I0Q5_9MONI|nr:chalcone isomerase [Goniophlebium niponicum]
MAIMAKQPFKGLRKYLLTLGSKASVLLRKLVALAAQQKRQLEFHGLDIEGISFESSAVSLGSSKKLVLGGAGNRGLEINGKFVKFTAIGIYVEDAIVHYLSPKLGGKSVEELCDKELLFEEVLTAPVEKLVRVVFLLPLTGPQYSEKVIERIGVQGMYPNLKDEYKKQFLEIFKAENFPPQSSLFLSFTKKGLKVAFSKGDGFPEQPVAAIEDKSFADAVLATIIWKDGVSPAAKVSLAERLSEYM